MTQSVSGGGHNGGGIFVNSEDHARFGLLYLNKGVWDNKRIISKEWIDKSLNPSTTNPEYGFMWWLNTEWNNCLLYTSPSPRDQRGSRMPSSA